MCSSRLVSTALACAWLLGGCVPIPGYFDSSDTRGNVNTFDVREITPGKTTREQLLLRLGEPDEASAQGRVFRYRWRKDFLWVATSEGAGPLYGREYTLLIVFDPRHRVQARKVIGDSKVMED